MNETHITINSKGSIVIWFFDMANNNGKFTHVDNPGLCTSHRGLATIKYLGSYI